MSGENSDTGANTRGRGPITSAEELHLGRLNLAPQPRSAVRLLLDLDICMASCTNGCEVRCSFFYHPGNVGVFSLRELATYALVCRRCEQPHCVAACPRDALEQQLDKDKLLIRHSLRCVNCRSCSHACPYGTIHPAFLPASVHNCDYCLDRREAEGEPLCIATCPYNALGLRAESGQLDEHTFLVGDHLLARSVHWKREKA